MKLTKRGKKVVTAVSALIAGSLFLSGFAVAKALEPVVLQEKVVQPVLLSQSPVEKQLKIKASAERLEKYRNKVKLSHLECKGLLKEVGFKQDYNWGKPYHIDDWILRYNVLFKTLSGTDIYC